MIDYASGAIAAAELSTFLVGLHEIYIAGGLHEEINRQIAEVAQFDSRRCYWCRLGSSACDSCLAAVSPSGSARDAIKLHGQARRSKGSSQSHLQRCWADIPGLLELVRRSETEDGRRGLVIATAGETERPNTA